MMRWRYEANLHRFFIQRKCLRSGSGIKGCDLLKEQWEWISGYEGIYQISSYGRLKSFKKCKEGYILSEQNKNGWYLTVNLFDAKGNRSTKRIHRLVAETYIGDIPTGYQVHHKDGDKQNNHVENLEIIHPVDHRKETEIEHPQIITGMNNYNKFERPTRIQQFDLDGHFIAEYANAKIASHFTGVCSRNILQVASKDEYKPGKTRKQAGGYVWKFKEESEVMKCS